MAGMDVPYEEPLHPSQVLPMTEISVAAAVDGLLKLIRESGCFPLLLAVREAVRFPRRPGEREKIISSGYGIR